MSKHYPAMDKVSSGALCFLFWQEERAGTCPQLYRGEPHHFRWEWAVLRVSTQKSAFVKAVCMDAKLTVHSPGSSSNRRSHYHQTGNYVSQNLLPCWVCGIRVCLREELWEGRSEAEAISLRPPPKSWSDAAASGSHTLLCGHMLGSSGLSLPLPAHLPFLQCNLLSH